MTRISQEQIDKVNACEHQWERIGKRRVCVYCNLGQVVDGGGSQFRRSRQMQAGLADMLADVQRYAERLESNHEHLKRAVRDAMGEQQCICEMRSGNPMQTSHSLQCQILRAQLECFK